MKNKGWTIFLVILIIAVAAVIAYVCYGISKGEQNPIVTMDVSYVDSDGNEKSGTIKIELYPDEAPESVANFITLANNGFYNGLTFHRMVTDFMIQGGDKEGDGSGSASLSDLDTSVVAGSDDDYTYSIKGEFSSNEVYNSIKFEKGVIGMARSDYSSYGLTEEGYNSASSQFFIVTTDDQDTLDVLNGSYAAFGKVIEGYDIIEDIASIYATEEDDDDDEETEVFEVSEKTDEEIEDSENLNVTITTSTEISADNVPEGWTLSEDALSISKEMEEGVIEKLTLVGADGTSLDYIVIAGKDNVPVMTTVSVETYGANYGLPDTINYDEILETVQTYYNYYQQLISSYSTE